MELSKLYDPSVDLFPVIRAIYELASAGSSKSSSGTLSDLISGAYSGQMQPLAGRLLRIWNIILTGQQGDGMDRDGGSGGSEGGGNAAVTASMRAWVDAILSVWIWVRHPDDGGKVVNVQVEPAPSKAASPCSGWIWSLGVGGNLAPNVCQWRGGGIPACSLGGKTGLISRYDGSGQTALSASSPPRPPPPPRFLIPHPSAFIPS
ncbi:hypothetical protein Tco_0709079 [Tanacetum coccineum]